MSAWNQKIGALVVTGLFVVQCGATETRSSRLNVLEGNQATFTSNVEAALAKFDGSGAGLTETPCVVSELEREKIIIAMRNGMGDASVDNFSDFAAGAISLGYKRIGKLAQDSGTTSLTSDTACRTAIIQALAETSIKFIAADGVSDALVKSGDQSATVEAVEKVSLAVAEHIPNAGLEGEEAMKPVAEGMISSLGDGLASEEVASGLKALTRSFTKFAGSLFRKKGVFSFSQGLGEATISAVNKLVATENNGIAADKLGPLMKEAASGMAETGAKASTANATEFAEITKGFQNGVVQGSSKVENFDQSTYPTIIEYLSAGVIETASSIDTFKAEFLPAIVDANSAGFIEALEYHPTFQYDRLPAITGAISSGIVRAAHTRGLDNATFTNLIEHSSQATMTAAQRVPHIKNNANRMLPAMALGASEGVMSVASLMNDRQDAADLFKSMAHAVTTGAMHGIRNHEVKLLPNQIANIVGAVNQGAMKGARLGGVTEDNLVHIAQGASAATMLAAADGFEMTATEMREMMRRASQGAMTAVDTRLRATLESGINEGFNAGLTGTEFQGNISPEQIALEISVGGAEALAAQNGEMECREKGGFWDFALLRCFDNDLNDLELPPPPPSDGTEAPPPPPPPSDDSNSTPPDPYTACTDTGGHYNPNTGACHFPTQAEIDGCTSQGSNYYWDFMDNTCRSTGVAGPGPSPDQIHCDNTQGGQWDIASQTCYIDNPADCSYAYGHWSSYRQWCFWSKDTEQETCERTGGMWMNIPSPWCDYSSQSGYRDYLLITDRLDCLHFGGLWCDFSGVTYCKDPTNPSYDSDLSHCDEFP